MTTGLLFDHDDLVGTWLFNKYSVRPTKYDSALGLIDPSGALVGAIIFHHFNGNNVELSYYGQHTLTVGIVRCIARYLLCTFDPSRLTVMTSKRNRRLMKSLQGLGFKVEGASRCYYGKRDCTRNIGVRFAMFRQRIEELAKTDNERAA